MATNQADQAKARSAFDTREVELNRLLGQYEDSLVTGDQDRRLMNDYRDSSRDYIVGAKQVMALAAEGRRVEATDLLNGSLQGVANRLSKASSEWIQHNDDLATAAGKGVVGVIEGSRRNTISANAVAILLTGILCFVIFRSIVKPIQALETSVKTIAGGDYAKEVPFTKAKDETGGLARSIDVLKRGAAAMEEQRWVNANAAKLTGNLQGAASLSEFGQRLVSGLVPVLGGGVAGFYLFEKEPRRLRRIAAYGLAERAKGANSFDFGEGLVGQCAQDRKTVPLDHLPPDYLQIASGLGAAAPAQAIASPLLSGDTLLGVLEIASFRAFNAQEKVLIEELLPVVAMSLEILQSNLGTQELLAQTQEQARQLEEQTEELTQSQEELLTQQRELTTQREELKVSEERSRLILESSGEGIFGTDTDGCISFVNPAACRMLGFSLQELIGQPSHTTFHHHRPDGSEYPKEECPMFAAYKRGEASRIDDEFLWRKDGTGLPVEYGATPISKEGVVVGAVVSFTDVTLRKEEEAERLRAEQRIRETEQFFRSVLELAPDGLMVADVGGIIQLANAQCERLFGYTRDELIGRPVEMLVPSSVRARHPELREAFHRAPQARAMGASGELRGQRKDGSLFPVEIGLSPLPARQGTGAEVALSLRDITERRRQEAEVLEAKEKAEEATEMKSMFLANMSHEIRTPMNAIIGLSHLALKTPLNAKQRDYVSKVHNAGTSLLAIINDILDFSKIEAGKLDIETIDFQIDEVIGSVTTLTAQKAHEKGLEFLADVSSAIPEQLRGDPLRLGQILTNLVNNAVKFTERGEIRLKIELLEQTGEKVQLKFSVRDTGIGMTTEQSAKLFQAFSQADMSTTRKHGGTGLGLTISRRLVELMGGQIWIDSEAGVGSTFTFTVWLEVGHAVDGRQIVPNKFQALRVLVVDDNSAAREILVESMQSLAERTDAVSSGPEAIAAIRERDADVPYDVVFMDWRMPGMDGLEATRLIKNDPSLHKRPAVIIVTAFGREEVREEAENLHVAGFLVKPVTKSMLVDSLVNVFASEVESSATTIAAGHETRAQLSGARILLTEDNEINQQIAIELLEGVGAKVDVADNGREAVDKLFQGAFPPPYDVVLMDLQMPEMDGYQATARIRGDTRFAQLPIIAMTAHATLEERNRCLAAGMNDHISKPIHPDLLLDTVGRYYHTTEPATLAQAVEVAVTPSVPPVASGAPPAAFGSAPAEWLPDVEGLDTADGLLRVAGNKKLYLKLLRQFVAGEHDAPVRIRERLAAQDRATAERMAHTVKGVAGSLGAGAVQAAADDLERAVKEGTPSIGVLCNRLASVLSPLIADLRAALGEPPMATPPDGRVAVDPVLIRETVARMTKYLGEFDPAASECLVSDLPRFRALFDAATLAQFEQHVNGYAFAEAQALLEQAAKDRGI